MPIGRNSFIQMTKLSNVKGRITYISSHAKQENLYAVYETTERKFWRELAKCNQEEFVKSGTEGKCIEARELIIALPESFTDYRDAYFAAREVEKAKENVEIRLYPINLSEFLEKNLNTYFSIKTYILDEAKEEQGNPQETPFEMECFIDNPLKKIIKVDMIDAQTIQAV